MKTYLKAFQNSVRTSQHTRCVSITKTNRLMVLREIIPVYFKNHMKTINTPCNKLKNSLMLK
jgi:hypothetical protein